MNTVCLESCVGICLQVQMGKVNGRFVSFCVMTDCLLNAFKISYVYNDLSLNVFKMILLRCVCWA